MNEKKYKIVLIVAAGTLLCLGLTVWMSLAKELMVTEQTQNLQEALNIAWKAGFMAIVGLLVFQGGLKKEEE
jgi:hypothetical protein